MGFLKAMLVAACANASCYSPDVRDCTVHCEREHDCVSGQVCGGDHFCASPGVSCSADAAPPMRDAAIPIDTAIPIDAQPSVAITLQIMGAGTVALDGVGSCDATCTLSAPFGALATLYAIPKAKQTFGGWTAGPCIGQPATCKFVPILPVTIAARFMKGEG
jgi:hypothetical protein